MGIVHPPKILLIELLKFFQHSSEKYKTVNTFWLKFILLRFHNISSHFCLIYFCIVSTKTKYFQSNLPKAAKSLITQLVSTSWCFQKKSKVQIPPLSTIELSEANNSSKAQFSKTMRSYTTFQFAHSLRIIWSEEPKCL